MGHSTKLILIFSPHNFPDKPYDAIWEVCPNSLRVIMRLTDRPNKFSSKAGITQSCSREQQPESVFKT